MAKVRKLVDSSICGATVCVDQLTMYAVSDRKALGQPLDLYDIRKFDAALGATLEKLYAAYKAHQAQGGSRKGPLLVDGCPIEDLCLTFVLPGYPEYELKKNGGDITVDASNVGSYITAVVDANLESGIKPQMDSFRLILLSTLCVSTMLVECSHQLHIRHLMSTTFLRHSCCTSLASKWGPKQLHTLENPYPV